MALLSYPCNVLTLGVLSYLTDNGGSSDPNSAVGNQGAALLIANITDTRNQLKALNAQIAVGNSDAGSYFNTQVLEAIDYGVGVKCSGVLAAVNDVSVRWLMCTLGLATCRFKTRRVGHGNFSRRIMCNRQPSYPTNRPCTSPKLGGHR